MKLNEDTEIDDHFLHLKKLKKVESLKYGNGYEWIFSYIIASWLDRKNRLIDRSVVRKRFQKAQQDTN